MDPSFAATLTLRLVSKHEHGRVSPYRAVSGLGVSHALWLLTEVKNCRVRGEKAHRWLAWAHCILAHEGILTLDQAKTINVIS